MNNKWIIGPSLAFIALNGWLMMEGFYLLSVLPIVLFLILMAFFDMEKLLMFIVFATPVSVNINRIGITENIGMFIPTEPLLFGTMLLFFFKVLHDRKVDRNILKHPATILILINLAWILITALTSTMPLVSIKYFVSRLWFVTVFYFIALHFFKRYKNLRIYPWVFIIPFVGVMIYTVARHAAHGFAEDPAHWVMTPFFYDHTSYGAILAFTVPFVVGWTFRKRTSFLLRGLLTLLLAFYTLAIIYSYTRATWVSLLAGGVMYLFLIWRVRFKFLMGLAGIGIVLFFVFQEKILLQLEQNRQDSSDDLKEHVQSISNIASDASNLERINRWKSAWRMFKDKPIFGFGPGTYQFKYAPYQRTQDLTVISTNFGNKGNAHSEYLGPLAESGVIGSLSFLLIVLYMTYKGLQLYRELPKGETRLIMTCAFIGLFTYYTHGVLNNFLTRDKASALFWGFSALLVAIDLYHREKQTEEGKRLSEQTDPE